MRTRDERRTGAPAVAVEPRRAVARTGAVTTSGAAELVIVQGAAGLPVPATYAIVATGLSKRYGGKLAVDDLGFGVRSGQVTGFLGPTGAGRFTALRLMLGLDRSGGRTMFGGRLYAALPEPARHDGAMLKSRDRPNPTRAARNHLRMLAAASRLPTGGSTRSSTSSDPPRSRGRVRRASPSGWSSVWGSQGPCWAILLLDEPANGLVPQGINWLHRLLRSFAAAGGTVLVSSPQLAAMP